MNISSPKNLATLTKQHLLQVIFPFTLPWFPLLLVYNDLTHAFPETTLLHNIAENYLVPISLAASMLLCLLLYSWRPDLLKVAETVSFPFLLAWGIINTLLIMYIAVTILVALISLLLDPPPWKSDNPQYIPLVFFAIFFYPPVLTPALAVVSIWCSALRKAKETLQ